MLNSIFIAIALGSVIDISLGQVGLRVTGVPRSFPPFTLLPILSGTVIGPVLAALVYWLIKMFSRQPDKTFLFVSVAMLTLSFGLPLRLSFTRSARFTGVTVPAQILLVLMHAVVAAVSVSALVRPQRLGTRLSP